MALLLLILLNSCTTVIHDRTYCTEIPGGYGAACDNFLSADQKILSKEQWEALKDKWINQGDAVVCTTSGAVGDIKEEIEELCSRVNCNYVSTKAGK